MRASRSSKKWDNTRLVANQNLDAAGVFCLERQKRLDIVV